MVDRWLGGSLVQIPIDGGTPKILAMASQVLSGSYVAVDNHDAYWTTSVYSATGCLDGALTRVPLDGSAPTALASGCLGPAAVDATAVFVIDMGSGRAADGTLSRFSLGSSTPTAMAIGQYAPVALAVSANRVFWTTSSTSATANDGALMAIAK